MQDAIGGAQQQLTLGVERLRQPFPSHGAGLNDDHAPERAVASRRLIHNTREIRRQARRARSSWRSNAAASSERSMNRPPARRNEVAVAWSSAGKSSAA